MTEQKQPTYTTPEELAHALLSGDEKARRAFDAMLANMGETMQRAMQNPTAAILDVLQAFKDDEIDAREAAEQVRAIAEKAHQSKQE